MVTCHCNSHGCGAKNGVNVDARTSKAHQRDDRTNLAIEACAATKRVVAAQEDTISAYLTSMTLCDNVSGAPKHEGGRLWARESPDTADLDILAANFASAPLEAPTPIVNAHAPRHAEPSRKAVTTALIQRLSEIDSSTDQLARTASGALSQLEHPPGKACMQFPLRDLLANCNSLRDDLDRVKSKVPAVVELQRSTKDKLDDVRSSILEAKRQWKSCRKSDNGSGPSQSGIEHNTGKLSCSKLQIGIDRTS